MATALEKKIVARIESEGGMTFCDFMRMALYDAEFGYYNTERIKIGAAGDYYTSSNVHPVFGAILARAFVDLWRDLEVADARPFTLLEMGAGTGQLALDILTALRDEHAPMFERARYVIAEQSPVMRARQQEKLQAFLERVHWVEIAEFEDAPITGIAFSNELVDAMPIHRARFKQGVLEELYVVLRNDIARPDAEQSPAEDQRLVFAWQKPSTSELEQYIEEAGVQLLEGQVIEINLDARSWLRRLSVALESGFLVTVDYGDRATHLYSPERRDGTLRCFYRHTLNDSPLTRIGEQDLTASVNFSALIDYGRAFGFETVSYERQTNFLYRLGLIERIAAREHSDTLDNLQDRLAIKNLLAPGGISDNFRVLIQVKSKK